MTRKRKPTKAAPDVEVRVHTVGGVFGDDKVTRVARQTVTVTNHGKVEAERKLPAGAQAEVSKLAHEVAELTIPDPPESAYMPDGGTTTIEISGPDAYQRIVLNAGDDAPQPVWDLLDGLERVRRDPAG